MGGVKVKEETAEILRLAKEPSLQSFGVVIGLLQLCTCTLYSLLFLCEVWIWVLFFCSSPFEINSILKKS